MSFVAGPSQDETRPKGSEGAWPGGPTPKASWGQT